MRRIRIHHPPGTARGTETQRRKYNVARISSTEIPWLKFSPRFSKEYKEPFDWAQGRREEKLCVVPAPLSPWYSPGTGCGNFVFGSPNAKFPQHFSPRWGILGVSVPRAWYSRRVVNLDLSLLRNGKEREERRASLQNYPLNARFQDR
jgi:hypothetical protein